MMLGLVCQHLYKSIHTGTLIPLQFMGKLRGKGGGGKTAQIITTKMEEEKKQKAKPNSVCLDPHSQNQSKCILATEVRRRQNNNANNLNSHDLVL